MTLSRFMQCRLNTVLHSLLRLNAVLLDRYTNVDLSIHQLLDS